MWYEIWDMHIVILDVTSGCTGPKRKFKWVLDGFRCTELRYVYESSDLRFVGVKDGI